MSHNTLVKCLTWFVFLHLLWQLLLCPLIAMADKFLTILDMQGHKQWLVCVKLAEFTTLKWQRFMALWLPNLKCWLSLNVKILCSLILGLLCACGTVMVILTFPSVWLYGWCISFCLKQFCPLKMSKQCNNYLFPVVCPQHETFVIGWKAQCLGSGTLRSRQAACNPCSVFLPVMTDRAPCGLFGTPAALSVVLSHGCLFSLRTLWCCLSCWFHPRTSPTACWMV